jgi:hypothetical protein
MKCKNLFPSFNFMHQLFYSHLKPHILSYQFAERHDKQFNLCVLLIFGLIWSYSLEIGQGKAALEIRLFVCLLHLCHA